MNVPKGKKVIINWCRTDNRSKITMGLCDNIQKEIERIRRDNENIHSRKQVVEGNVEYQETSQERRARMAAELDYEKGCTTIYADKERVQTMRHQTGQLGGMGAVTLEEIQQMRAKTQKRLEAIEDQFFITKQQEKIGDFFNKKFEVDNNRKERKEKEYIEKMKNKPADWDKMLARDQNSWKKEQKKRVYERGEYSDEEDEYYSGSEDYDSRSPKKEKYWLDKEEHEWERIPDKDDKLRFVNEFAKEDAKRKGSKTRHTIREIEHKEAKEKKYQKLTTQELQSQFGKETSEERKERERSEKRKQWDREENESWAGLPRYKKVTKHSMSPRRELYEAKFGRYKNNKDERNRLAQQFKKDEQNEFDVHLKGPDSLNVKARRVAWAGQDPDNLSDEEHKIDFNNEKDVYNPDYDKNLVKEGVRDKIKIIGEKALQELPKKDKVMFSMLKWIFNAVKKDELVNRDELLVELSKNDEIVNMLGFDTVDEIEADLYDATLLTGKKGYQDWPEFVDFFLNHQATVEERKNPWWKQIVDAEQKMRVKPKLHKTDELKKKAYDRSMKTAEGEKIFEKLEEEKERQLQYLMDQRVGKLTDEVEKEYKDHEERRVRMLETGKRGKHADEEEIFTLKCNSKLLPSHIEILDEIFTNLDKY